MKRVLVVASVISMIEWFNKENIDYLKENRECDVHLAVNFDYMKDTIEERTKEYLNRLKKMGVVLHNIPFARSPLNRQNIKAFKQLKKIIDSNNFDLIHCHTPAASMITRLAAKSARKKGAHVMYTCHGFHFHNRSPKKNWILYYPVERLLARFTDTIVTINKEDFNRIQRFHVKGKKYIPGVGVDLKKIKSIEIDKEVKKESIGVPRKAILVLSIGELIDRKNHEVIIKAISRIGRDDIYYAICGKGPLRNYLDSISKELGISERVKFLGFREDVAELCHAADISAFPSKIEGLGLAGIEAMAAGVPLVASNVHGILDYVVDGKTGFTCAPNDIIGFSEAIKKLAEHPEQRIGMKEACLEAVGPFDKGNALVEMQKIYVEVLNS